MLIDIPFYDGLTSPNNLEAQKLLTEAIGNATEFKIDMIGSISQSDRQRYISQLVHGLDRHFDDPYRGAQLIRDAAQILLCCSQTDVPNAMLQMKATLKQYERYYFAAAAEAAVAHATVQNTFFDRAHLRVLRPAIIDDVGLGLDWIIGDNTHMYGVNVKACLAPSLSMRIYSSTSIPTVEIQIPTYKRLTFIPPANMIQDIRSGLFDYLDNGQALSVSV
ncbi:MAG: hypothetical protein O3B87_02905 [bacterium]|nr:hypothetical protein [bacterium]